MILLGACLPPAQVHAMQDRNFLRDGLHQSLAQRHVPVYLSAPLVHHRLPNPSHSFVSVCTRSFLSVRNPPPRSLNPYMLQTTN